MELQTRIIPMEELSELIALQLESGGVARLTVTGCSMLPLLRHGKDAVELTAITGNEKKGDILLYRRKNGQFVLHRAIAETQTGFLCCGDNQAQKETVDRDQLLAVVCGYLRGGKHYTLRHFPYRVYTAAWVGLFPLRRYYIAIRRRLGKLRSRLRRMLRRKRHE